MLTLGRVSHQVVVARRNRHLARTAQRPLPPAVGAAFGAGIYPETPQPVEPSRLPAAAVPRRQHGLPSSVGARGGAQWSVRGVFFGCTSPRRAPPYRPLAVRVSYDICAGSAGTKPFTAMTSRYQSADAFGVRACVS